MYLHSNHKSKNTITKIETVTDTEAEVKAKAIEKETDKIGFV